MATSETEGSSLEDPTPVLNAHCPRLKICDGVAPMGAAAHRRLRHPATKEIEEARIRQFRPGVLFLAAGGGRPP